MGEGARQTDSGLGAEGSEWGDVLWEGGGEVAEDALGLTDERNDVTLDSGPLVTDDEVGRLDPSTEVEAEQGAWVEAVSQPDSYRSPSPSC